jgi:Bacterial Ig-like domain
MKTRVSLLLGAILFAAYLTGCGGSGGGDTANSPPQQTDTSKPAVNSTTPEHNSVAVEPNRAITVTFNEPIDPATITTNTFIVAADVTGAAVTGSVTYEESSRTAIFRHGGLSPWTAYTATVTTGVKDLAGNAMGASYAWRFTTGEARDTTPPTVLATYPIQNAGAVPLNTAVAVTFSEAIDPATINAQTFILMKDGATQVAGSVTYVGTTALFKPAGNLLPGASYTTMITVGVKDLAGNAMAENFTWGFTTGSESDLQSPQVQSVSPPSGSQDVPVDSPLVVFFNEPVMPFDFGLIDGRPVVVAFNATYTTVTMKPTIALLSGSTYISSIRVQDMAGNQMSAPFSWQYSTRP